MSDLEKEEQEIKEHKNKKKIKEEQKENETKNIQEKTPRITVGVPTRNRYDYLSLLLWSLLEQSYVHWDLIIIDDSDPKFNITQIPFIWPMLMKLEAEGHSWKCIDGERKGPHISHQKILSASNTEFIFRIDDDCIMDKYCLEKLVNAITSENRIGAVAPVIVLPHAKKEHQTQPEKWHSIEKYFGKLIERPNGAVDTYGELQWHYHRNMKYKPSEHLYSSFIYRKSVGLSIGGFAKDLSEVGHTEETDFTYRIHLSGWKMYVVPESILWHFQAPSGGIRDDKKSTMDPKLLWEKDKYRFLIKYHEYWKKGLIRQSTDIGEIK
jgi:GT2 family glycosyltransferase